MGARWQRPRRQRGQAGSVPRAAGWRSCGRCHFACRCLLSPPVRQTRRGAEFAGVQGRGRPATLRPSGGQRQCDDALRGAKLHARWHGLPDDTAARRQVALAVVGHWLLVGRRPAPRGDDRRRAGDPLFKQGQLVVWRY